MELDNDVMFVCVYLYVCFPQSSVYSLALKSIISFSTFILLGLIIAYHCCEIQVTYLFIIMQSGFAFGFGFLQEHSLKFKKNSVNL